MKTIVVTGANSGIGKEAALLLAADGHRVLMLCRDGEKSTRVFEEIVARTGNESISLIPVDLSSGLSIRAAAQEISSRHSAIDVLVNNAGVYMPKREETADGIEMNFAVNYLAPFILSHLLLPSLEASGNGRIINVVSALYEKGVINLEDLMPERSYKAGRAYASSKMACVLFTIELAKRTADTGVTVNALHPGVLATGMMRHYPAIVAKLVGLMLENAERGGERIAALATSEEVEGVSGTYFFKSEARAYKIADRERVRSEALWRASEELTGMVE